MGAVEFMPVRSVDPANTRHAFQVEVDRVTESEWSAFMDHFEDVNIYQTWAFGAVRWSEAKLSHLILRDGKDILGMAQLRIVRPTGLRMGVAYLRWGPLFHRRGHELDTEVVGGMAEALLDEYVRRRGLHLEILPNAFRGSLRAEVLESQFKGFDHKPVLSQEKYRTFLLDISLTGDELRKALDKKWRNQLNVGIRNNLQVLEGQDAAAYDEFRSLYEQMWRRKKFESAVKVEEFQEIQQRLPERQKMKLFLCRVQGKSVAGVVCSALGDTAIYLLGASNEDGLKVKASYVLQWAAIQSAKECGIRFYDLGGIDPVSNPGVYHFKSGLCGRDVSHLGALTCCESPFSAAFAKASQVVRGKLRAFQHATRQKSIGEQSK